jgi:hypothetical protein
VCQNIASGKVVVGEQVNKKIFCLSERCLGGGKIFTIWYQDILKKDGKLWLDV